MTDQKRIPEAQAKLERLMIGYASITGAIYHQAIMMGFTRETAEAAVVMACKEGIADTNRSIENK